MTKRREFIKKSILGSAGLAIGGIGFTSKSYTSIVGANERINVAGQESTASHISFRRKFNKWSSLGLV
jgi:hypothetical protein